MTGECRSRRTVPVLKVALSTIVLLVSLTAPGPAAAQSPAPAANSIATLEAAAGQVTVLRLGQASPATSAMALRLNDVVVTQQGRATVRFHSDGTVVRVGPDSRVQIDETATQRDITLFFGRIWAHVLRVKERPTRFKTG